MGGRCTRESTGLLARREARPGGGGLRAVHVPIPSREGAQMKFRKLSTTLAILSATAGVSAFAASAQAVVVTHYPVSLNTDPDVNLSSDAEVTFDYSGGTITPRLTATLGTESDRC